ncbi:pyridoxal-phosphate dependent enzyme [Pseudomaricurvus alkylphenolicus]|uniref:threonine ammonia-lyase n=1 Tax=Pseudomaricurvus alkylphenolicus TaxID=1306991 RepID=UPI00141E7743|nr:pyridoxal-phosphate dependent enzyme [Pseudomaricurvus alkylphenolicus]NIB38477.1 pyridoxal-phosphate dependent enzyme [Pseudomaricurvus alkylphenolicus]
MVTLDDINKARLTVETLNRKLKAGIRHTPLIPADRLSRMINKKLIFKAECLQVTGSFKVPGILNTLANEVDDHCQGILGVSSGNQGLCIAYIAGLMGKQSLISVPPGASAEKQELIRSYGGEVVEMKFRSFDEALKTCTDLAKEKNYYFPNLFENENFIAGHGTLGAQILEDLPDADVIVIPGGSGVLAAGLATACKSIKPSVKVYVVGAENSACLYNAYRDKRAGALASIPSTICDGLRSPVVTQLILDHVLHYVDDVVSVTDDQVMEAMRLVWSHTKLLSEPSGAVTLAALLNDKLPIADGSNVVCLLTGGNTGLKDAMRYLETAC